MFSQVGDELLYLAMLTALRINASTTRMKLSRLTMGLLMEKLSGAVKPPLVSIKF